MFRANARENVGFSYLLIQEMTFDNVDVTSSHGKKEKEKSGQVAQAEMTVCCIEAVIHRDEDSFPGGNLIRCKSAMGPAQIGKVNISVF